MHDIVSWLATPLEKPKLLVIYWPTACGKTALTIDLAKKYNGEVISADSRQIYRGIDIGTGKITTEEMQWVPHYMLDICDISEPYSVGEYVPRAIEIITDITARGKLPILSWGTGLFIDAIVWNFDLWRAEPDWEYRAELEKIRETLGEQKLWEMLHEIDPDYASQLDARNYRYVMRGLEVFRATGASKKLPARIEESHYDTFFLTPFDGDREKLYERINERVIGMFENWLVSEVETLLRQNAFDTFEYDICRSIIAKFPWLNAIGYREVIDYLAWIKTLPEAIESVQINSRHYAKRQLTWFRRYQNDRIDGFFGA